MLKKENNFEQRLEKVEQSVDELYIIVRTIAANIDRLTFAVYKGDKQD